MTASQAATTSGEEGGAALPFEPASDDGAITVEDGAGAASSRSRREQLAEARTTTNVIATREVGKAFTALVYHKERQSISSNRKRVRRAIPKKAYALGRTNRDERRQREFTEGDSRDDIARAEALLGAVAPLVGDA